MSVAVKKVNGVENVNVSLNEGKASIRFTPASTGKYADVRSGIEKNGFEVREAQLRARGKLHKTPMGFEFIVSGSGEVFRISNSETRNADLGRALDQNAEREVVLDGTVPAPEKNKYQDKLLVTKFEGTK